MSNRDHSFEIIYILYHINYIIQYIFDIIKTSEFSKNKV